MLLAGTCSAAFFPFAIVGCTKYLVSVVLRRRWGGGLGWRVRGRVLELVSKAGLKNARSDERQFHVLEFSTSFFLVSFFSRAWGLVACCRC